MTEQFFVVESPGRTMRRVIEQAAHPLVKQAYDQLGTGQSAGVEITMSATSAESW